MKDRLFSLGAVGIIFNEKQEVLLMHRTDHDFWCLPGGGVEHGESPWDAVVREVEEETRLRVAVDTLTGIYTKTNSIDFVFVFLCTIVGGTPGVTEEARAVRFFPLTALPKNMSVHHADRIADYVECDSFPVMKKQEQVLTVKLLADGTLEQKVEAFLKTRACFQ